MLARKGYEMLRQRPELKLCYTQQMFVELEFE